MSDKNNAEGKECFMRNVADACLLVADDTDGVATTLLSFALMETRHLVEGKTTPARYASTLEHAATIHLKRRTP